jgi:deazaflavin-dependent oxidoreductase (nitroreductase family)
MTAEVSANAWEDALVADMRAHDGNVTSGPLSGHPLLLMTLVGAKTGKVRRSILTWSRDGDDYIVAGSKGGAPTDPLWVNNVRVEPEVTIEVGNRTVPATATIVEGAERDRLWDAHVRTNPWFGDYPEKSGRIIPMIRLTPRAA